MRFLGTFVVASVKPTSYVDLADDHFRVELTSGFDQRLSIIVRQQPEVGAVVRVRVDAVRPSS